MCRIGVLLFITGLSAGCGEEKGVPKVLPETCTDGDRRCSGTAAQSCSANTWSTYRTCGVSCDATAGVPSCIDHSGHLSDAMFAVADVRLTDELQYLLSEGPDNDLRFENWPGYDGAIVPGSAEQRITIDNVQADYETCGTCLLGYVGTTELLARSGTMDVTVPALPDGVFSITLTDVVLREVRIGDGGATSEVTNAEVWEIDSLTLTVEADRFACDELETAYAAGDTFCTGDFAWTYGCIDDDTSDTFPGLLTEDTDCTATGLSCFDTASGALCAEGCSTSNAMRCGDGDAQTCSAGRWQTTSDCGAQVCWSGTAAPACYDACSGASRRCNGNSAELCNGEVFLHAEDCATSGMVCDPTTGGCVAESCDAPGSYRCSGNTLQSCDGTWSFSEDCGEFYTCDLSGTCGPSPCDAEGVERCAGDQEQSCVSGTWTEEGLCSESGSYCRQFGTAVHCAAACTETGAEACDGTYLLRCDGTAMARAQDCAAEEPPATCVLQGSDASCVVTCDTAGATRCNGQTLESCNAGTWEAQSDCSASGRICYFDDPQHACVEPCTQGGMERCDGNVLESCNGIYWRPQQDCAELGLVCDPTYLDCVVESCSVGGSTRCNGQTVQTCNGSSNRWEDSYTCDAFHECRGGGCFQQACPYDQEGYTRCAGNLIQQCYSGGWADGEDCASSGATCTQSDAATAVCTP